MKRNKLIQRFYKQVSIVICLITCTFLVHAQVVVIDPGHGYTSDGDNKDKRTLTEIYTALSAGLKLRDLINNSNCGWTVHMTRTTNEPGGWISVTQRATMSNNWNATRFISIHCNGGGGTGTETFYCNQSASNTADDFAFARTIQDDMVQHGQWNDRRCVEDYTYLKTSSGKPYHLGVLRTNNAPACLNEIGFVDSSDESKLLSNSWRDKFALAYFESLKDELGNCSSNPPDGGGICPATQSLTTPIQANNYEASSSIFASNVVSSGTVNFKSPAINLTNGFEVTGGIFYAENVSCNLDPKIGQPIIESEILFQKNEVMVYPNPVTASANIHFNIEDENPFSIFLTDVTGKEIDKIVENEQFDQGNHQINFNAENYPAGIYFVSLKSSSQLTTNKFIIN